MHHSVVALVCIIFVVGAYGAARKIPATIDKDAIELAQLAEKIWSFKPAIMKRAKPLAYCQVIDQCCQKEHRSEAISLFGLSANHDDRLENLLEQCMNTTTSNKEKQVCPVTVKSILPWGIYDSNPDVQKYENIIMKYLMNMTELESVAEGCNSEEIHAFVCSSDTKLVNSCAGKILQEIYDNDYKNYPKTIKSLKQLSINANQELSKEFIKNTKTE